MRLLSLGFVFVLPFSTYVIATPTDDGEGQPPAEGTPAAPEASGSGSGSGGGGDGGFNWDDINTSDKGWGKVQTKYYVRIK